MITTYSIPSLDAFLARDLNYLCDQLRQEFGRMAGKRC